MAIVAVVALAAIALSAAAASAAPKCTGAGITGVGAALQRTAQQKVWAPAFASTICNSGTHPTVAYEPIGSDAAMREWNYDGVRGAINAELPFLGTSLAPTAAQITNIKGVAGGSQVAVIPVAQTAIAVVANPPAGCEVEAVTNGNLEAIFEGRIRTWDNVETAEGEGCESPITRVVPGDPSNTTRQFKNYLYALYKTTLICPPPSGPVSWQELEPFEAPNLYWPRTCPEHTLSAVLSAEGGGAAEMEAVNATTGGIGYATLPDAKANVAGASAIVALQNNGQKKVAEANFANAASGAVANCSAITYQVPKTGGGLDIDWSGVFGAKPAVGGESYPLCELTYALAFSDYSSAGFSEGQEITVRDYLNEYVVQSTGQAAINGSYYSALPASAEALFDVAGAARKAAKAIAF